MFVYIYIHVCTYNIFTLHMRLLHIFVNIYAWTLLAVILIQQDLRSQQCTSTILFSKQKDIPNTTGIQLSQQSKRTEMNLMLFNYPYRYLCVNACARIWHMVRRLIARHHHGLLDENWLRACHLWGSWGSIFLLHGCIGLGGIGLAEHGANSWQPEARDKHGRRYSTPTKCAEHQVSRWLGPGVALEHNHKCIAEQCAHIAARASGSSDPAAHRTIQSGHCIQKHWLRKTGLSMH